MERYAREPWSAVLKAFAWGGIGAALLSVLAESFFSVSPFILGVVVAPLIEEGAKGLGLLWLRDAAPESEDGLVYGAAVGLGFAVTENLLYGGEAFLAGGAALVVTTLLLRTFTSTLLHGSATALTGFGLWRRRAGAGGILGALVFFALAMLAHAAFNALASVANLFALPAALLFALTLWASTRKRIRRLDARAPPGPP